MSTQDAMVMLHSCSMEASSTQSLQGFLDVGLRVKLQGKE